MNSGFARIRSSWETPYDFGNIAIAPGGYEEEDRRLSEVMTAAWVRFAMTGDPNGPGLAKMAGL